MRHILSLGAVALVLAGCVAPVTPAAPPVAPPAPRPAPAPAPTPPTTTVDAAARTVARTAINREMARRLPGVNVAPYTDCVVNNASMAEIADIARAASNTEATANAVAAVVRRPATSQCIARVAATA
ncbi:MAG: hypothetical protein Q4F71_07605 [Paracoccus sp. (in: a-proteobacteria)]|nr:hypothetical protein [Paracoccus sp. (in: a-proteobacteria)]